MAIIDPNYKRTTVAKPPGPGPEPEPVPPPKVQCTGGNLLHTGKPGVEDKCGEGFVVKGFQVAGGYLHEDKFETWCCPAGEEPEEETIVCYNGLCVSSKDIPPEVTRKLPQCRDANGDPCPVGTSCTSSGDCSKKKGGCTSDEDCGKGYECNKNTGKCEKIAVIEDGEGCEGGHKLDDRFAGGKGRGLRPLTAEERAPYIPEDAGWMRSSDWQGHIIWHKDYGYRDLKKTHDYYKSGSSDWTDVVSSACEKGFERKTIDGEEWCCPAEGGGGGGGDGWGEGSEFKWSEGTQDALQKLLDRYNYLMENPRGTTDAERQAIINFATERLKRGERGEMQSMTDRMSRMGLLGSGFQESEARGIQRGTREDVVGLQRQVAMGELDRRFTELMGGTQMAQGLMGTMMTGEQIPEILSAARRGEGTTAMQQFLAYLQMIMGSYGQGSDWLRGILG